MPIDVILGGGISGYLVAQRLFCLGRNFAILERSAHRPTQPNAGFFYLHEPIFGDEKKIKVVISACNGATPERYAQKVYGDPKVGPVSIKSDPQTHDGWILDMDRLTQGLEVFHNASAAWINTGTHQVGTHDGRVWQYDRLHSTVPMPVLMDLLGTKLDVQFNSRPIWVEDGGIDPKLGISPNPEVMECYYCASDCHDWYRKTLHPDGRMLAEFSNFGLHHRELKPGKIWYTPDRKDHDIGKLVDYRRMLESMDIFLWGRYATWTPKMLTHMVWRELNERLQ